VVLTATKTCAYWSCQREVKGRNFLCSDHYEDYQEKLIDKCPNCGRYKDQEYEFCLDCKNRLRIALRPKVFTNGNGKKARHKAEHSKAWEKADEGVGRFFVYVLKLDNGEFYIGHTRELRERLSEHRDGKTTSIAGRQFHLQYFEVLSTREAAELREVELKKLRDKNPRQIRRMIIGFQDLLREVNSD
jgi:predicted GIY-YIG superfamily endonuclease